MYRKESFILDIGACNAIWIIECLAPCTIGNPKSPLKRSLGEYTIIQEEQCMTTQHHNACFHTQRCTPNNNGSILLNVGSNISIGVRATHFLFFPCPVAEVTHDKKKGAKLTHNPKCLYTTVLQQSVFLQTTTWVLMFKFIACNVYCPEHQVDFTVYMGSTIYMIKSMQYADRYIHSGVI